MRKIVNINRKWAFSKRETTVPSIFPENWCYVNLPHSWNAIDGQDGDNDYFRGTCYYVKKLLKEELPEAGKYYLEIKGANSSADVYLNGKILAHHDGGYSTWRVDITNHLTAENLLVIAVDNSANDTVYPQFADFTFYGGLYRDINIICTNESHFELMYYGGPGVKVTPEVHGKNADVEIETYLANAKKGLKIKCIVNDMDCNTVLEIVTDDTKINFTIENAHLWQGRKDPYLYIAHLHLLDGDEIIDNVSIRFGCRYFEIDPERGFVLNGEEYPLRGVSRHQDRWGLGNALLPEHHEEDIDLIMEVGATTIRLAHYQHDQYFYDLCDEKGLVIWAEIPYISKHMPTGRDNTISQMTELVVQNYNHPSIVVWGLSNEITMQGDSDPDLLENHKILNDLVHDLDKTRKTVIAAVSMCDIDSPYIQIPDAVSYNHYFGWYGGDTSMNGPWFDNFHKRFPDIPIGCSEYGCEALNWHTSNPQQGDYTEEYQAYYHEELIKQLFTRKYMWATHVWNMFDFGADSRNEGGENGQNHKGLVTFDRKYKKDSFYAYKAWLSDEKFVHICGKRYVDRVEDITKVTVYSNMPEVELFVNGESIGKKRADDHFFYFDVESNGKSELVAVAGECKDKSIIRKVDTFNNDYRLVEKGAVLNWFDIDTPEGYFSLNDKLSDIMAVPDGAAFIKGLASQLMKGMEGMAGSEDAFGGAMMQMMGGFTVIRLTNLMGAANVHFSKEDLLSMNAALNKIK